VLEAEFICWNSVSCSC